MAEEAKATRMLARVYFEIDRTVDRAENTAQHAIQLQTEIENIADVLTTYRLLANIEIRKENLELATMYLNKAIDFSDMLNNLFEKGAAFFLLIVVYSLQEKYEQAEKLAHESLTLFRRLGNRRYESMTLHEMSLNHLALGNYDQAKDITNQTLEIYQAIGDRLGYGYALRHLGNIYKALGQSEKAQQALGEAKQIAGFLGHRHLMNLVTQSLNNLN